MTIDNLLMADFLFKPMTYRTMREKKQYPERMTWNFYHKIKSEENKKKQK